MRAGSCSRPARTRELGDLPDATPAPPVRVWTGGGGHDADITKDFRGTRESAFQSQLGVLPLVFPRLRALGTTASDELHDIIGAVRCLTSPESIMQACQ